MDLAVIVKDAFETYRSFQEAHPHLGSTVSAEIMFLMGDTVSQLVTDRTINSRKLGYTAVLAPIYGLAVEVLMESGEVAGKYISQHPFVKAALGPNLWGNLYNTFFFVNNSIGEKSDYNIRKLAQHYRKLISTPVEKGWQAFREQYLDLVPRREYFYATAGTVTVWNAIHFANYAWIPPELRIPLTLGAGLVWTSALSLWSLRGGRKVSPNLA